MTREQSKAAHYIQQLDEARCNGNWDAVPELLRKVRKHAPSRSCLTLTAECEHAIHQSTLLRQLNTPRPGTAGTARPSSSGSATSSQVSRYIPVLIEEIEQERSYVEDGFQAEVCLGSLYWHLGEAALAISRLPKSIEQEISQLDGTNKESTGWTRVCALKASYIKGIAQNRTGSIAEALETFESSMPILSTLPATYGKELWKWTELFLTGFCMLSSHAIKSKLTSLQETETLSAFRAWGNFWDNQASAPQGGRAAEAEISRRGVWKEYYITLSDLLQQDLPFPTTALTTAYKDTSTKLRQRAELKRIEAKYEILLLSEIQFPKAEQASEEVESFVEIVMENWRILCGSDWKEHDIGEGGFEALSRGVLDILYRAATKTFHSTAILRHLFTVHLAIAEFEIAFKAFDTYFEIVKKGKARVDKTGAVEHGLDDDETVLRTIADCVAALCRYGTRQGAEKAKELGKYLEEWLEIHHPSESSNGHAIENGGTTDTAMAVRPESIAMTWRSIGICHAQWARVTYDAASRGEIQGKAIASFKKALSPEFRSSSDVETLFALGTILAERRELSAAIEVVKAGLLPKPASQGLDPHAGSFLRERRLIPLWHLMALLLSARQEFVTAARSCEGAFEQFQDPKNLFGEDNLAASFRSDHLNEKPSPHNSGLVDDMDDFEKESVLQVKMTQLALIEVLEGPEVAVNASDELLSLYTRLFGDPQKESPPPAVAGTLVPPKSSAGTIRSIGGSIFGRTGRSLRRSHPTGPALSEIHEKPEVTARPQTTQTIASTIAPTIQVTGENGCARQRSSSTKGRHHHERLQKRSDGVSGNKSTSARNRSSSTGRNRNADTTNSSIKRTSTAANSENHPGFHTTDQELGTGSEHGEIGMALIPDSYVEGSTPLSPNLQQMLHTEPFHKSAQPDPSNGPDTRLPRVSAYSLSSAPLTRFPKDQARRREIATLVNVWLLIGGFYRRALLFEDSRGAVDEAEKLVQALQDENLKDTAGVVSVQHVGWGGGKSVGELWGDIFSERGYLAVSEKAPYTALHHFEFSLTNFADHPSAIVGLSGLLLDIYTEKLCPPPAIPPLVQPHNLHAPSASTLNSLVASLELKSTESHPGGHSSSLPTSPRKPLGLPTAKSTATSDNFQTATPTSDTSGSKELTTSFLDRLAARDRAYGLLSGLTKLGSGWNYSEAWFALARAYEEGGQPDKAREVLWWCVELEEGKGVRGWAVVGSGGYVL